MDNKQLLERAAKAAGYEIHKAIVDEDCLTLIVKINGKLDRWNPIESDADAFRLLVKVHKICADNPKLWEDYLKSLQDAYREYDEAFTAGDDARSRMAVTVLAAEIWAAAQSQESAHNE